VVDQLQLSLLNIGGTRAASRRRMADVRSLGFSELFVLSKDDLWNVLEEFPEAKTKMIEVGKERLRQDGLLTEQVTWCHWDQNFIWQKWTHTFCLGGYVIKNHVRVSSKTYRTLDKNSYKTVLSVTPRCARSNRRPVTLHCILYIAYTLNFQPFCWLMIYRVPDGSYPNLFVTRRFVP